LSSKARHDRLSQSLREAKVLVCAGTGGVGKTTLAAALAIQAARRGRRTLVLTIDPARRLADALGLDHLDSTPTAITLGEGATELPPGAQLDAMMLDPKPTFDRLIERLTSDSAVRARIFDNRIYQHLSGALAGSAEYAAMEQVHEAVQSGSYDLVVVDTPPASHALDFLAAPRRLRTFLEGRIVRALVRPAASAGRFGWLVFGRALQSALGLVERIAGGGFLEDLSEFLRAIEGLSGGLRDRATRVEALLLGESTHFVLIAGAKSGEEPGTLEFLDALSDLKIELCAVILNRLPPWPLEESPTAWLEAAAGPLAAADETRLREALAAADETRLREALAAADETRLREAPADPLSAAERDHAVSALMQILHALALERASAERTEAAIHTRIHALGTKGEVACHRVLERTEDLDRIAGLTAIGTTLLESPPP